MIRDWPALAAQHPELAPIPSALRAAAQLEALTAGETLFRQGERPKAMYCILDGERLTLRQPGRRL